MAKENKSPVSKKVEDIKPEDKRKALETALTQIKKQFGEGAVMRLGQNNGMHVDAISTGSLSLDLALGIGGLPRGRIIEIYGPESSGKTTLALHCVAEGQKMGGNAAFIDVEHALDPVYASALGVDVDSLLVSQPDTGEQALEITEALVRSNAIDVIVVDSVAALVPRAEIEGEMGDISEDILGVARRNIEAEFGEEPVENVNLLSYNIEKLDTLFAPDEKAARIYVNFCNPWQKAGDHKRRLTHTRQLNTYKKVLAPGGELWFKTDNTDLYLATQRYLAEAGFEILCKTDDLHSEDAPGNIQSEHEVMFTAEGIKTKAIIARWNGEPETPERVSTEQAEKVENTAE